MEICRARSLASAGYAAALRPVVSIDLSAQILSGDTDEVGQAAIGLSFFAATAILSAAGAQMIDLTCMVRHCASPAIMRVPRLSIEPMKLSLIGCFTKRVHYIAAANSIFERYTVVRISPAKL